MNLVDNALKFAGAAELQVSREGSTTIIRVLDNGPGIPGDELDDVLKPFYRVEGSRNRSTGGTGLGLAIAHQLIQAMGAADPEQPRTGRIVRADRTLLKCICDRWQKRPWIWIGPFL